MKQKTETQQGSIEQLIYEETERRLEIMQSDTYEFPKKMTWSIMASSSPAWRPVWC